MTYLGLLQMWRTVDQELKVSEGVKPNRQEEKSVFVVIINHFLALWPQFLCVWKLCRSLSIVKRFRSWQELWTEGQLFWLILNSCRVSQPPAAVGSKAVLFSTFLTVIFPALSPFSFPICSRRFHTRCLQVGTIQAALLAWPLLATKVLFSL